MAETIARISTAGTVALTASLSTTPEIHYHSMAGGTVYIPTGSPITSLTWYCAENPSGDATLAGTYIAAYDFSGSAATQTVVAPGAYPIPVALFGAGMLKCVVNSAGSVTITLKG